MRVGHESQGMTLGVYCKVTEGTDKIWVPEIEKLLYGDISNNQQDHRKY